MDKHTYRQGLTWDTFFVHQYNEPSRSDYYLMQVAAMVKLSNTRKGTRVTYNEMTLKWNFNDPSKPKDQKQASEWAKAAWLSRLGVGLRNGQRNPSS